MSGNVAVIHTGDLAAVAGAFAESAAHLASEVQLFGLEDRSTTRFTGGAR